MGVAGALNVVVTGDSLIWCCGLVVPDLGRSRAGHPHGALQLACVCEIAYRFLQVLGGIAKLGLGHHWPHARTDRPVPHRGCYRTPEFSDRLNRGK
jgi:hypothetical protein